MVLPQNLMAKYLARFDELIAGGQSIYDGIQEISPGTWKVDHVRYEAWQVNCISLLDQVLPREHIHRNVINRFGRYAYVVPGIAAEISRMRAIRDDFNSGLLGDIAAAIEAEVASDYMGQAGQLLADPGRGKFDHVPAAVLAGAVLEKTLRTLCTRQSPPISIEKQSGKGQIKKKTLNDFIDDLKRANVFNEARAKQLRGFADIRNHAAHGEFDQFNRGQVEQMVAGIANFIAESL